MRTFLAIIVVFLLILTGFACAPVNIVNKQPGTWEPIEGKIELYAYPPRCKFEQIALLCVSKSNRNAMMWINGTARSLGANAVIVAGQLETGASFGIAAYGVAFVSSVDELMFNAVRIEPNCPKVVRR